MYKRPHKRKVSSEYELVRVDEPMLLHLKDTGQILEQRG